MDKQTLQITVYSSIKDAMGEVTEMTLYTEATYKKDLKKSYLMYNESEVSGMEGTKTLLTLENESVFIRRYGENSSLLKIEIEQWHENMYNTQYGTFVIKTKGESIKWDDEERLTVDLFYLLEIEGEMSAPSEVTIKIEQKRG